MPVVATVKRGRELARRRHVGVAVQHMTDFVWVLFLDARQSQFGESLSCMNVEFARCRWLLRRVPIGKRRAYESNQHDENPKSFLHRLARCLLRENGASRQDRK